MQIEASSSAISELQTKYPDLRINKIDVNLYSVRGLTRIVEENEMVHPNKLEQPAPAPDPNKLGLGAYMENWFAEQMKYYTSKFESELTKYSMGMENAEKRIIEKEKELTRAMEEPLKEVNNLVKNCLRAVEDLEQKTGVRLQTLKSELLGALEANKQAEIEIRKKQAAILAGG